MEEIGSRRQFVFFFSTKTKLKTIYIIANLNRREEKPGDRSRDVGACQVREWNRGRRSGVRRSIRRSSRFWRAWCGASARSPQNSPSSPPPPSRPPPAASGRRSEPASTSLPRSLQPPFDRYRWKKSMGRRQDGLQLRYEQP